jgi:ubiquinone/menaquinone biosynthesis C-methylase UbiE
MDLPHTSVRAHFAAQARLWKEIYESETVEAAVYRTRQDKVLAMVDTLQVPVGARVLELGCGAGLTAAALAQRGFWVHAVDLVPQMLTSTRELAINRRVSKRVSTLCADAEALPFADRYFDLVIGIALLEWTSSATLFRELARVMGHGSHVILTATNRWSLQRCLDPHLNPGIEPVKKAIRRFSRPRAYSRTHSLKDLDRSLATAGLVRQQASTAGFGPFTFFKHKLMPGARGARLHDALQRKAERRWLSSAGYAHIVMAVKPETREEAIRS